MPPTLLPLDLRPAILIQNMIKKHLYNQNEAREPEELEELEADSEFKELGDEDSEGAENPKSIGEDDASEEESGVSGTEDSI